MGSLVSTILGSFLGSVMAILVYLVLTGQQHRIRSSLLALLRGVEGYGTYPPGARAAVNDRSGADYEFPMQRNNARRPARENNRTRRDAIYPVSRTPSVLPTISGQPSKLPSIPTGAGSPLGTSSPVFAATAYESSIWEDPQPANASFGSALLDDMMPNPSVSPVRRFSPSVSRVPVDS